MMFDAGVVAGLIAERVGQSALVEDTINTFLINDQVVIKMCDGTVYTVTIDGPIEGPIHSKVPEQREA